MKTVTAHIEVQVDDRLTDGQITMMLELVVLPGSNEIVKVTVRKKETP